MEQKVCKSKNCSNLIPENSKSKYCEKCKAERAQKVEAVVGAAGALVVTVGSIALKMIGKK